MKRNDFEAIVIGGSAGALEALSAILPGLPEKYSLPIMVVVHLPADKASVLADLLNDKCRVEVLEAHDKQEIQAGQVYIAPPDYHLLVEQNRVLSLSMDEPVLYSRPSIDILFETAADCYHEKLLGIVLSGANSDGALGLKAVVDGGGGGIVQLRDEASSETMPEAALKIDDSVREMSLDEIAHFISSLKNPRAAGI